MQHARGRQKYIKVIVEKLQRKRTRRKGVILKSISEKQDMRVLTKIKWFRTRHRTSFCEHDNELFCSIKYDNFLPAKWM
jgi:hypothetical protein